MLEIFLAALALLLTGLILIGWFRPHWLGVGGKTLWDWVSLLLVPSMVGFGTALISFSQYQTEQERAREIAVQQFIDRVSQWTIAPPADAPEQVNAVLRAQTMTILRMVEGKRAGQVIGFLAELGLLQKMHIEFEGLDLAGAELKALDLHGVDFEESTLRGAELERSDLGGADFTRSDLTGADLKSADMKGASLELALLKDAELDHADLRGADLGSAKGLTKKQLGLACLDQTSRLPDGFDLASLAPTGCFGQPLDD